MNNPFVNVQQPNVSSTHPHGGATMHAYGFHDVLKSADCIHCIEEGAVNDPLCIYIDRADWWVGYYRGTDHHYVCLIPCVVIRWRRR